MATHTVTWTIQVETDNAQEAAEKAREYQRKEDTTAVVFEVENHETGEKSTIDLLNEDFED